MSRHSVPTSVRTLGQRGNRYLVEITLEFLMAPSRNFVNMDECINVLGNNVEQFYFSGINMLHLTW